MYAASTHAAKDQRNNKAGRQVGRTGVSRAGLVFCVGMMLAALAPTAFADNFTAPTKDELEMKSLPGYPEAAAVVLFREEIDRDDTSVKQHYERIKILTEEGKRYANVELAYVSTHEVGVFTEGDDKTADSIQGRTIHPDGTIIPFTGKPYLKVIEKTKNYRVQEKVFTLPDVEVGSIIEYRYATRINDNMVEAPQWMLQGDLYVKKAHYVWYPTPKDIVDEDGALINSIAWFPVLRAGDKLEHRDLPSGAKMHELTAMDIPPTPKEDYMPPVRNFTFRVMYSLTPYRSQEDYWKAMGKRWSKHLNAFIGPNAELRAATEKIVAGATTDDEKLHRIYATVMSLENTQYTRDRDEREDKAAGVGKTNNAADVLAHKRGTPWQLTELFIGMARAAGLQAYGVWVPDRSEELVVKTWLSTQQFDDLIALVKVNGKDTFFDPGSRYEPYGRLAWQHTFLPLALRQTDGGTDWTDTPGEAPMSNTTFRVANLTMDQDDKVTGSINMSYNGAPAVRWRQSSLRGDNESVRKQLEESVQGMVPKTLEIKVAGIEGLDDYEKPLVVKFTTTGSLGTMTGKRMVLPVNLFTVGSSATFPHEKREIAVYFPYAAITRDVTRVNLPPTLVPEAVPDPAQFSLEKQGVYGINVVSAPASYTTRRDVVLNSIVVLPADYPKLRTFYTQFEAKDQESVVLKPASQNASSTTPAAPAGKSQ